MTLQSTAAAAGPTEPVDEAQRTLAGIWQDVLEIDGVGIHDDFFALGGDSLLSIRVLARAGKAGLKITPADFFAYPTIAGQAAKVSTTARRRPARSATAGPIPLLPIQRWFFEHIDRAPEQWNLSYLFDIEPSPSLEHLQRAAALLLNTHDALRCGFRSVDGDWQAQLAAPGEFSVVGELDVSELGPEEADAAVRREADRLNAGFDLARPPLLRVCLVRTPQGRRDRVLIVAHHLVIDAESWRIVLDDLSHALHQLRDGRSPELPERTDSIGAWANRLAGMGDDSELAAAAPAWSNAAGNSQTDLQAQRSLSREELSEGAASDLNVALTEHETRALLEAVEPSRSSVREMLLAAVARALGRHTGGAEVRIEMEGHGRETPFDDVDITRTVGWMTIAYPVTVRDETRWEDPAAVLRGAKSALRDLPHNGLSYGATAYGDSKSSQERALRDAGHPAVLLNFLGQRESRPQFGDLRLVNERCGEARSPETPRAYLLEINASIEDARLTIILTRPAAAFSEQTVHGIADDVVGTLRALSGLTSDTAVPGDFPLANLDQQGLDDLSSMLDDFDD